eukprot:m.195729 g.195729  ORF g.195729 m.195729 type:complete len:1016 (-) comp19608_c0_seq1:425-3472(-)
MDDDRATPITTPTLDNTSPSTSTTLSRSNTDDSGTDSYTTTYFTTDMSHTHNDRIAKTVAGEENNATMVSESTSRAVDANVTRIHRQDSRLNRELSTDTNKRQSIEILDKIAQAVRSDALMRHTLDLAKRASVSPVTPSDDGHRSSSPLSAGTLVNQKPSMSASGRSATVGRDRPGVTTARRRDTPALIPDDEPPSFRLMKSAVLTSDILEEEDEDIEEEEQEEETDESESEDDDASVNDKVGAEDASVSQSQRTHGVESDDGEHDAYVNSSMMDVSVVVNDTSVSAIATTTKAIVRTESLVREAEALTREADKLMDMRRKSSPRSSPVASPKQAGPASTRAAAKAALKQRFLMLAREASNGSGPAPSPRLAKGGPATASLLKTSSLSTRTPTDTAGSPSAAPSAPASSNHADAGHANLNTTTVMSQGKLTKAALMAASGTNHGHANVVSADVVSDASSIVSSTVAVASPLPCRRRSDTHGKTFTVPRRRSTDTSDDASNESVARPMTASSDATTSSSSTPLSSLRPSTAPGHGDGDVNRGVATATKIKPSTSPKPARLRSPHSGIRTDKTFTKSKRPSSSASSSTSSSATSTTGRRLSATFGVPPATVGAAADTVTKTTKRQAATSSTASKKTTKTSTSSATAGSSRIRRTGGALPIVRETKAAAARRKSTSLEIERKRIKQQEEQSKIVGVHSARDRTQDKSSRSASTTVTKPKRRVSKSTAAAAPSAPSSATTAAGRSARHQPSKDKSNPPTTSRHTTKANDNTNNTVPPVTKSIKQPTESQDTRSSVHHLAAPKHISKGIAEMQKRLSGSDLNKDGACNRKPTYSGAGTTSEGKDSSSARPRQGTRVSNMKANFEALARKRSSSSIPTPRCSSGHLDQRGVVTMDRSSKPTLLVTTHVGSSSAEASTSPSWRMKLKAVSSSASASAASLTDDTAQPASSNRDETASPTTTVPAWKLEWERKRQHKRDQLRHTNAPLESHGTSRPIADEPVWKRLAQAKQGRHIETVEISNF